MVSSHRVAIEARQAAALAATQDAEAAAREAAMKAEQEAQDGNTLSGPRGRPPRKQSGKPLATPAMPPAKLGSERQISSSIAKMPSPGGERRSQTTGDGGIWDMKEQRT